MGGRKSVARVEKILAFRIRMNGKGLVTAGIRGAHAVSTIISSVVREPGRTTPAGEPLAERELQLDVGGLNSVAKEHVDWVRVALKIGDSITIDVVETSIVDEPKRRRKPQAPSPKTAKAQPPATPLARAPKNRKPK